MSPEEIRAEIKHVEDMIARTRKILDELVTLRKRFCQVSVGLKACKKSSDQHLHFYKSASHVARNELRDNRCDKRSV